MSVLFWMSKGVKPMLTNPKIVERVRELHALIPESLMERVEQCLDRCPEVTSKTQLVIEGLTLALEKHGM